MDPLTLVCTSVLRLPEEIHTSPSIQTQELLKKLSAVEQASQLVCNTFLRAMGKRCCVLYLRVFSIISLFLHIFKMQGVFPMNV